MRVVFDVTSCCKERRGGIGNYGTELLAACARVEPHNDYVLGLRPNRWLRRALVSDILPDAPRRPVVDALPGLLGRPVDAFHGIGVRLPARGSFPRVVMMHDLNVFEFPELSSDHWRQRRRARIRQTVDRADLILALSGQGRDALGEHLGVEPERVRVVPHGVDTQRFRPHGADELEPVLRRHDLLDRPYVMSVGEASPRKNHGGLLEAFVRADLPEPWTLLLGGPRGDDREALAARARELGLPPERLRLPGWVTEDDLAPLVAGASIYCCASLHEGFGMPVLEAQACGTAVASSDRAALSETLGEVGLAFDPADVEAFAGALVSLAGDAHLRSTFEQAGPRRVARHYTWDRVARLTLDVLREAGTASPSRPSVA